ncbi:MAG: LemA family protein [Erysipelotrichaceae bacterium]|nr:LemA family protein [Erysipelotrichaceae bacterium]
MIWVILAVLVLLVIWFVATYNGFVSLRNRVDEAFSTMDVYLVKRYDLIPNLVETVKGYTKHESETLEKVIKARNAAVSATTPAEKLESETELAGTLSRLFALTEAYPELKANTNFMNLQDQLNKMEGEIANARKYYNGVVKTFNTKCETIPSNIIAGICGFVKQPMFVVQDESQRDSVKVQF